MKLLIKLSSFIGLVILVFIFWAISFSNLKKDITLYIPTGSNYEDLKKMISHYLESEFTFDLVSKLKQYKNIKAGRYSLKKTWGNNKIINYLRVRNEEIDVIFNNQETINDLAGDIAYQIEADSISILNKILDKSFLKRNKLTKENVISIFIPNTYKFYWNTTADKFVNKMILESKKFWNNGRIQKLEELKLNRLQVITLASIVNKETTKIDERSRVAGLYINRLKKGMKLQSDPTVIYALKKKKGFDLKIKRVLYKDLLVKSPYNTYLNLGIPPSPICIPDVSSIDAVLNYERHNYIFMCASVDRFGYHNFSRTLSQHNRNKDKYVRWLRSNNIKR